MEVLLYVLPVIFIGFLVWFLIRDQINEPADISDPYIDIEQREEDDRNHQ